MMSHAFEYDIDPCLKVLQNGGLIIYPTDTVWGIGCDATNAEAVDRIYRLKQRLDHKAMVVLLADERDILTYVTQTDLQVFDYIKDNLVFDQLINEFNYAWVHVSYKANGKQRGEILEAYKEGKATKYRLIK
jgi:tRNA A37 threonylcarbamoyladenosine synthetase subunit TsaC/SUA5/YrdC